MKKVISFMLALSFFLSSFMIPRAYAIYDRDEPSFWLNYWVEEKTGLDMSQIPPTAYGLSYADYIYRQTGHTVDFYVNSVTDPQNVPKYYTEYQLNTLYNNTEFFKDILNTTPIGEDTASKYQQTKQQMIDGDGNINVSGSNYYNSVYNGLSQDGYNDIYHTQDNGWSIPSLNLNIQYVGICATSGYSFNVVSFDTVSPYLIGTGDGRRFRDNYLSTTNSNGENRVQIGITVNGFYTYVLEGYYDTGGITSITAQGNSVVINAFGTSVRQNNTTTYSLRLNVNISQNDINQDSVPVLQPRQVGFIKFPLGSTTPVYVDPSQNPFTVNDDGTVTINNDDPDYDPTNDTFPIYINPDDLSPEGDIFLIQYVVYNIYGDDNYPHNPFGDNPDFLIDPDKYDSQSGSSTIDYSKHLNNIINWLKKIYTKEQEVCNYLSRICKGLGVNIEVDEDEEDEDKPKIEDFSSLLYLFDGTNNDGLKSKLLQKFSYGNVQTNLDNFTFALFGSRTFNQDGTVNTQFGSMTVTEYPELNYTYEGQNYNAWEHISHLDDNGYLTYAKELVRFFIIFGFILSVYRQLPNIIHTCSGVKVESYDMPETYLENGIVNGDGLVTEEMPINWTGGFW